MNGGLRAGRGHLCPVLVEQRSTLMGGEQCASVVVGPRTSVEAALYEPVGARAHWRGPSWRGSSWSGCVRDTLCDTHRGPARCP